MNPDEWKDLSIKIVYLGTLVNLFTALLTILMGAEVEKVVSPTIFIQAIVFGISFLMFSHGMNLEEENEEEKRLRDLEDRIKTLEDITYLQKED